MNRAILWHNKNWTMLKMKNNSNSDKSRPPPSNENSKNTVISNTSSGGETLSSSSQDGGLFSGLKALIKGGKPDTGLREAIEEYIEKRDEDTLLDPVSEHERVLFANILKLRDITVDTVMVPRADIIAVDVNTRKEELFKLLASIQYSRIPVFESTLDEVLGTVHLKDIIRALANNEEITLKNLLTEIPIVSPSLPVLDLLMTMRESRRHMALVVDEYGGIDGLVTIGDIIETIFGEIEDEHDMDDDPQITETQDGAILVDARVEVDEFENEYGQIFDQQERDESDTLGGLVSTLAGRVPVRGEVLNHDSGTIFEILEADQRRVKRIKIYNIPTE
tara:strand:- start:2430 stop:3434 length:1005 start_codon:yes stop_codon:yes gene_type:complete